MNSAGEYCVIYGIREDGKKLRPTDWIERLSSVLASFEEDRRLRYSLSVKPCILNGEKCLVVARCLETADPQAYRFIMQFAESNHLKVQLDRRQDERALACDIPPAA